jgi:hypothetical protein
VNHGEGHLDDLAARQSNRPKSSCSPAGRKKGTSPMIAYLFAVGNVPLPELAAQMLVMLNRLTVEFGFLAAGGPQTTSPQEPPPQSPQRSEPESPPAASPLRQVA